VLLRFGLLLRFGQEIDKLTETFPKVSGCPRSLLFFKILPIRTTSVPSEASPSESAPSRSSDGTPAIGSSSLARGRTAHQHDTVGNIWIASST
jgi:hypothetical protein